MKKILDTIRRLKAGTVIRTILQVLVYVNQAVALLGNTTFANNIVYQWISFALTVVITALSYWYNNDWTQFAHMSSDIFDMLKDGKITPQELEDFMAKYGKKETTLPEVKDDGKDSESKKE